MDGISVAAVATGLCAIVALPYFLWTRLFHPSGPPAAVKGERDVLERLYRETDGPNWVKNEHWGDPAVPIGRWHGVKLNGSGHVHKLILPRNRLRGPLPADLADLQYLDELDLRDNGLTGEIPASFGRMRRMEGLYLYGNRLTGDIPRELLQLGSLMGIYLYNNNFDNTVEAREWLPKGLPKDCLVYL